MKATNRFYSLYSERPLSEAWLGLYYEQSFDGMLSFKDKQKRFDCVNGYAGGLKI